MSRIAHAQDDAASGLSLLNSPVLLLNRFFAPVSVASARRALVLLYAGAAQAIDDMGQLHDFSAWRRLPVRRGDDGLPIVGGQLRIPRVLHLLRYDRYPKLTIRLTRRNLLLRDDYQCQYCGCRPGIRELNVDHIVPRCRGGQDTWTNLVVSCRSCNLKKGRRMPDEAGMHLRSVPKIPRWSMVAHIKMATRHAYEEWQPFLQSA